METLKRAGVQQTVMLTGDSRRVAEQVAADLGVGRVYSELLPADKVAKVEELLAEKPEGAKLAFVGDGINDAPVLRRADIGIAMGAMGSDAADRGRGRGADGRRSAEDRQGDPDLAQVPADRLSRTSCSPSASS